MPAIPPLLIESLEGLPGFDRNAFSQVHASGEQLTSVRYNPLKSKIENRGSIIRVPWAGSGYYLEKRPSFTFDPLFHAGCYYVQEASSMFLEQALKQATDLSRPLKVLDLCAAPGGKSTHIQSLISKDSLLVSNEVIRSRASVLKENIIKWGCANVMVTNNDPRDFAKLTGYFDVIVIDAPCSGSGLFRRDPGAIEEWSEDNVQLCSQRQQRILADVFPALKEGGILVYSTCSYSKEEDEDIVNWMMNQFPLQYKSLQIEPAWGITDTGAGYRFWPDKVKGEGFFISCFQKTGESGQVKVKPGSKVSPVSKNERMLLETWVEDTEHEFVKHASTCYAWPHTLVADFSFLLEQLRVVYSGILIGEILPGKLLPDHAFAMSRLPGNRIPRVEVEREVAIQYLQRKDIKLDNATKGWQLVSYEGEALGWVNVLPNRVNNYYPKELRILKEN